MPRLTVPDGPDHITDRVWNLRPELGTAAKAMKTAAYGSSILPTRLQEAVRFRIALINDCQLCRQAKRPDTYGPEFYSEMHAYPISAQFSDQEKLAICYAERYANDHHSLDDEFYATLKLHFSEPEILDLTFIILRHISFGRLTHSLGLDDSCEVIAPSAGV